MIIIIGIKKLNHTTIFVIIISILCCILTSIIEIYLIPSYTFKSICKIVIFLVVPLIYCGLDKNISFKTYFLVKSKRQLILSLFLGVGVYIFLISMFFILKSFIDLYLISANLSTSLNVTKNNFIFVSLYISLCNSLLEEFFFRGFTFLSLRKTTKKSYAYIFSALLFALYHVAIMSSWFNFIMLVFLIFGLFISALLFNWLNDKNENIYTSWMVHIFANFAINTIGFYMFGII